MRPFLILSIALFFVGCGGSFTVKVNGTVTDSSGGPLLGAEVLVHDTDRCCAGEEKPCRYTTNETGKWSLEFSGGKVNKDPPEQRFTCHYTVSKAGHSSKNGTFTYCELGPCVGDQDISTDVAL